MGKYYYNNIRLNHEDRKRQVLRALNDLHKSKLKSDYSVYDIARQMGMRPSQSLRNMLAELASEGMAEARPMVHRWTSTGSIIKVMYTPITNIEQEWPGLKINGVSFNSMTKGKS